jgi:hypothetical protein
MNREPTDRDEPVPPELQRAAAALGATSAGRAPSKPTDIVVDEAASVEESGRSATDAGPGPNSPKPPVEGD